MRGVPYAQTGAEEAVDTRPQRPLALTDTTSVVRSPSTTKAFAHALIYAPTRCTVVIVGATGAGKTHLARYIHRASNRADRPFISRTAAEITESLGAAQLFGNEKWAFTDARERRKGLLAEAGSGTLLLDDLHQMTLPVQALLLRALSERCFVPVGAQRDYPLLCRLIAGLAEHPDAAMAHGALLPDLRYRLGRCVISLAPLAERREEIGLLATEFLRRCPEEMESDGPTRFSAQVIPALEQASWRGNARELESAVQRAFVHARGEELVRLEHFDDDIVRASLASSFRRHGDREANSRAVHVALEAAGGCRTRAAEILAVSRRTVRQYL